MWLYLWARMERHAGSCSYIQGSTRNHENEGKTNNLGWMLYSVCAVLGGCCTRWMLYSVYAVLSVCYTRCQLMIMTWRDGEGWLNFVFGDDIRVMDEKERDGGWRWDQCGGYARIWEIVGTTYLIGLEWPRIGVITRQIGTLTCRMRDSQMTHTRNSLKSQFLIMISPVPSHLSLFVLNSTIT